MSELLEWFKGITPGGIGIWSIVGMIAVALIRQKPIMQKLSDARDGNLLMERANDMSRLREEVAEVKELARRLENMVACMRPAISILTTEVRRLDPGNANNPALLQVGELMAMAAAGDLGFSKALTGLATAKGKGE